MRKRMMKRRVLENLAEEVLKLYLGNRAWQNGVALAASGGGLSQLEQISI